MKMKVLVLLLSMSPSLALAWETDTGSGSGSGSGRPYHYGEERFRHWTRSRQGRFRVQERFSHELLEDAVGKYKMCVACAELEDFKKKMEQKQVSLGTSVFKNGIKMKQLAEKNAANGKTIQNELDELMASVVLRKDLPPYLRPLGDGIKCPVKEVLMLLARHATCFWNP